MGNIGLWQKYSKLRIGLNHLLLLSAYDRRVLYGIILLALFLIFSYPLRFKLTN